MKVLNSKSYIYIQNLVTDIRFYAINFIVLIKLKIPVQKTFEVNYKIVKIEKEKYFSKKSNSLLYNNSFFFY